MSELGVPNRPFIPANLVLSSDANTFSEFQPIYEQALTTVFHHGLTFQEFAAIMRPYMSKEAAALTDSIRAGILVDESTAQLDELGMKGYNGLVPDLAGLFATLVSYLENRFPVNEHSPPDLLCAIDLLKRLYALTYWARWPLNPTPQQAANQLAAIASVGVSLGMLATYLRQFQDGNFALMAKGRAESERPKQRFDPKPEHSRRFTVWWESEVARGNTPTTADCETWRCNNNLPRDFVRKCRRERQDIRPRGNYSNVTTK